MTQGTYGTTPPVGAAQALPPTLLNCTITTFPATVQADKTVIISVSVTNNTTKAIQLDSLEITLPYGTLPTDLSDDNSNATPTATAGWALHADPTPGKYTAKPVTPKDSIITANAVVFVISNIPVNNQSGGPVSITLTETTGTPPRKGAHVVKLNKAPADFFLDPPYCVPTLTNYGGPGTIYWHAMANAQISLAFDGQTHTHVKGKPGTPLPAQGSYTIDNMTAEKTVTVIADNPGKIGQRQLRQQLDMQIAAARIDKLQADVTHKAGALPTVAVSWTVQSATSAMLTSNRTSVFQSIDLHAGRVQQPIAVQTDFILSAQHPAYNTPTPASVSATPPALGWTPVSGGPSGALFLQAMPDGLVGFDPSTGAFSSNGIDWVQATQSVPSGGSPLPNKGFEMSVLLGTSALQNQIILITENVTTANNSTTKEARLHVSSDYQTFTELPAAPWAQALYPRPAIATGPNNEVFAFGGVTG